MKTKNINLFMGNHEAMMLDYYENADHNWLFNGSDKMRLGFNELSETERNKIFKYLRSRPYYKTIGINGRRYFLSHAGLDASLPFNCQLYDTLVWSRLEFYGRKALKNYICVFGHTPTYYLRSSYDCSVWFDEDYNDKICIDCGCVYGGALAALRLDDGEIFYVKSNSGKYLPEPSPAPARFFSAEG